jgi:hypothetical protein
MTCYLKSLIKYVDQGHTLQSYDDVPKDIREQLYKEEQQSLKRHKKSTSVTDRFTGGLTNGQLERAVGTLLRTNLRP